MLRLLLRLISDKAEDERLFKDIPKFKKQLVIDTRFGYLSHPVNPFDYYLYKVDEAEIRACPQCKKETHGIIRCRKCHSLKSQDPLWDLRELVNMAYFFACTKKDTQAIEHWKGMMSFLSGFNPPPDRL